MIRNVDSGSPNRIKAGARNIPAWLTAPPRGSHEPGGTVSVSVSVAPIPCPLPLPVYSCADDLRRPPLLPTLPPHAVVDVPAHPTQRTQLIPSLGAVGPPARRRYERMADLSEGEEVGPLEATIKNLGKEIDGKGGESKDLQRRWISCQTELVGLQVRGFGVSGLQ